MTLSILLCTDRSENALAAVSMGGRLAAALDACDSVTLLAAGKKEKRVRHALIQSIKTLNSFGITPKTQVSIGPAIEQFIHEIERKRYDLVVAGYRKRNLLEKALWGSAATRMAHKSTTSMLIVRKGRTDIQRILIGLGGNGFTKEIIHWGSRIAAALGAAVTVLHVESTPPLMYADLPHVHQSLPQFLETDTPAARSLGHAIETLDQAGVPAELLLAQGVTSRELLREAQDGDYDLIIIGSAWARPGLQRVMLPNMTQAILLQTQRPVLVVYPPGQETDKVSN